MDIVKEAFRPSFFQNGTKKLTAKWLKILRRNRRWFSQSFRSTVNLCLPISMRVYVVYDENKANNLKQINLFSHFSQFYFIRQLLSSPPPPLPRSGFWATSFPNGLRSTNHGLCKSGKKINRVTTHKLLNLNLLEFYENRRF